MFLRYNGSNYPSSCELIVFFVCGGTKLTMANSDPRPNPSSIEVLVSQVNASSKKQES